MALDPVVNFFRSTIATLPVASGGTSIVLQTGDGNKLPAPAVDGAFNLTIYNADDPFVAPEIVRVTARSGDTLTVTRAQEGTSATNKTSGSTWNVELTPTAKTIQDIDTTKLDVAGGTMTGDLTIPDKIIHSGDTNTAIRFPANDTWSVETNGTEKIRVTSTAVVVNESGFDQDFRVEGDTLANLVFVDASTDRVGINTATPATLLDVNGTVTGGKFVPTANTVAGNGMYLPASNTVAVGTNGSEALRVDSSQNLGIKTTTPRSALDVNGDVHIVNSKIIQKTVTCTDATATNIITVTPTGASRAYCVEILVQANAGSTRVNTVAKYIFNYVVGPVGFVVTNINTILAPDTVKQNSVLQDYASIIATVETTTGDGRAFALNFTSSGSNSPFNTTARIYATVMATHLADVT